MGSFPIIVLLRWVTYGIPVGLIPIVIESEGLPDELESKTWFEIGFVDWKKKNTPTDVSEDNCTGMFMLCGPVSRTPRAPDGVPLVVPSWEFPELSATIVPDVSSRSQIPDTDIVLIQNMIILNSRLDATFHFTCLFSSIEYHIQ